MKGITELSYLLPVIFTARNVADNTYVACRTSVNTFYHLRLIFKHLSVRVVYDISLTDTICHLSMNGS